MFLNSAVSNRILMLEMFVFLIELNHRRKFEDNLIDDACFQGNSDFTLGDINFILDNPYYKM